MFIQQTPGTTRLQCTLAVACIAMASAWFWCGTSGLALVALLGLTLRTKITRADRTLKLTDQCQPLWRVSWALRLNDGRRQRWVFRDEVSADDWAYLGRWVTVMSSPSA